MRAGWMSRIPMAGLLVVAACGGEAEPATVWFIEPTDGQEVIGSSVQVVLGVGGVEITSADIHRQGTGHHHIFVNVDVTPMGDTIPAGVPGILHLGRGQTEFLVENLQPGENRLIAVVADWAHIPLDPPAVDTVFIQVVPADPDEG